MGEKVSLVQEAANYAQELMKLDDKSPEIL